MSEETIFSKIIRREIPADIVYEDDLCLAFRDIAPQAPVHILIIPREPLSGVQAATQEHQAVLGHLLVVTVHMTTGKSKPLSNSVTHRPQSQNCDFIDDH